MSFYDVEYLFEEALIEYGNPEDAGEHLLNLGVSAEDVDWFIDDYYDYY